MLFLPSNVNGNRQEILLHRAETRLSGHDHVQVLCHNNQPLLECLQAPVRVPTEWPARM